uniref:Uncharacterized protein n=1 Tax=Pseudictyota dubia TaxID=2749911 RepID=A0A7R9W0Q5_9STRA|mmetsp:Transcript_27744/g.51624  ORF Transcript_27744/g.51624 Transcript_27744/m.51624 type:complete len:126 (+) Transcript_27744:93-470(+)
MQLKAQMSAVMQGQGCEEMAICWDWVETACGARVRSKVSQPYNTVQDHRSRWETSDMQRVLDSDLEGYAWALLWARAKEGAEQEGRIVMQVSLCLSSFMPFGFLLIPFDRNDRLPTERMSPVCFY